ncbi:MAG: RNA polymerase sigma factor [Phycisphaerales bacterium]|nr:RNA polymerase sigma factor [Phycisphaerales bacterium]
MNRQEEAKLIAKAAAGDARAAETFIRAHQQSLYAYLLRLSGRPDVAEDIVQEAFVRVLTNLHRFDSRFRFSTWLFTIARRLYVNACQKHKPAYDSDLVGSCHGGTGRPENAVMRSEATGLAKDALGKALQELSPQQREILVLFHQLDWPISLIAQHVGMPEGTVKSHLHRGRKALKKILDGEGCVETPEQAEPAITTHSRIAMEVRG